MAQSRKIISNKNKIAKRTNITGNAVVERSMRLDASVPANNQKIIELYNKIRKEELDASPDFQRKLVWKKQHKIKFIDTILNNYPFPEIYLAPDPNGPNLSTLTLKDLIVDGQQRLTTIVSYIEGKDVFATEAKLAIPKFFELSDRAKADFLNYEISVRYLKNADKRQIKDVFERINSTEYALNNIERTNAQWGDSEFICFSKQIIEKDLDVDTKLINYRIDSDIRQHFLNFFNEKYDIFTESDSSRMLSLQYIMTLVATLCEKKYFDRNSKVKDYIEAYYDEFLNAGEVEYNLKSTIDFIDKLKLGKNSFLMSKTNLYTLICEIYAFDRNSINISTFREKLLFIESGYLTNSVMEAIREMTSIDLIDTDAINARIKKINVDQKEFEAFTKMEPQKRRQYERYFEYSREGVNNKAVRDFRGSFIRSMIIESLII